MEAKLKKGQIVELTVNANAIPAGRYKFEEQDGEMLIFSIGPQVLFGLAAEYWGKYLVARSRSGARRTTRREFLVEYYRLLGELRLDPKPFNPSRFTFCMLAPECWVPPGGAELASVGTPGWSAGEAFSTGIIN
jgi:hypothetical protein